MKNKRIKQGFTLIELLVVVLIIGILASVALPQYQLAVTKTKYANLKNLTQSIYEAEQLYFLENGTYTNKFAELTLDIGGTGESHTRSFSWGYCVIESEYVYCQNTSINFAYLILFSGERVCVTHNVPIAHKICKMETGSEPDGYGWYKY